MNEELMRQNLENNRYQSSSVVDNILTIGIANSALENSIKNSLAKTSSASFQMALKNGGIYHNNAMLGSSNMYRFARWITGGKISNGKSGKVFGLGRYEVNKFSASQLDPKKHGVLNDIGKNLSSNAKDWDINSDIIPTGYGVQNSGYKEFFNQLEDMGFELNKARDANVNLTEEQYKIYEGLKRGDSKYNYIKTEQSQELLSDSKNIDKFVNDRYDHKINKLQSEYDEITKKIASETDEAKKAELIKTQKAKQIEKEIAVSEKQSYSKNLYDEKEALDFWKNDYKFNQANVSDDLYNSLTKDLDSNIQKIFSTTSQNSEDVFSDMRKLEKAFKKIGKSSKEYVGKIDSAKRTFIRDFALKNSISEQEAIIRLSKASTPEAKEAIKTFKNTIDDVVREFSDDVGVHFAKRTAFQKFIGNKGMQFLSGVKAGAASFLWQLPAMVVSATASINQDNAVQNFVSSYLYNPKTKEMYNSSAVNKSMQISQNIHYSNLQDSQNIIIKHNTAERYLNDLDPINIELDYTQKSFDLNPRNE